MKALNQPEMSGATILSFNVTGLGAGAAAWFIGYLLPSAGPAVMHLFPRRKEAEGVEAGPKARAAAGV